MDTLQASTAMMDTSYLDEHDVIQRYIRHALSDDELAAFEILLISRPELIDEIETQRLINASFKQQLAGTGYKPGIYAEHINPLMRKSLPLAAGVIVALLIGLNTPGLSGRDSGPSTVVADTVTLQALRSSAVQQAIDMTAMTASGVSTVTLPLRIDVGPQLAADQRYALRLVDTDGAVLVQATALAASADGWLDYRLQVARDMRGVHQLEISEVASGDSQVFELNLR
ncbi:MAG: hypothetical protein V4603_02870 [Pseudomonadota bacterium]